MKRAQTFLIEPFDIMLHATEEGVSTLQSRFSTWLRTLRDPARFICWQMPATLDDKIRRLTQTAFFRPVLDVPLPDPSFALEEEPDTLQLAHDRVRQRTLGENPL